MRRVLIALPLALAVAPAAHAAQVQTVRACYLQQKTTPPTVDLTGSGFPPETPYSVSLDGTALPTGDVKTSNYGEMSGRFSPPGLGADELERTFQVEVGSGDQKAATSFAVTRFSADYAPRNGLVRRLKVRFSLFGFGLAKGEPNPDVYVHWVTPRGKLRATGLLGRAQGACGSLRSTNKRRLFPFQSVQKGDWTLQLDTRRKYRRGRASSSFLFYTIGVRVT
jgi:hypothetical protein